MYLLLRLGGHAACVPASFGISFVLLLLLLTAVTNYFLGLKAIRVIHLCGNQALERFFLLGNEREICVYSLLSSCFGSFFLSSLFVFVFVLALVLPLVLALVLLSNSKRFTHDKDRTCFSFAVSPEIIL